MLDHRPLSGKPGHTAFTDVYPFPFWKLIFMISDKRKSFPGQMNILGEASNVLEH